MVLKKNIRAASRAIILVFMVLLFSCENLQDNFLNCSECKLDEPSDAEIEIKLSDNYSEIRINIFEGNLEDSILYKTITTVSNSTYCTLPLNKTFTLAARYLSSSGNQYIAVNSITPHVRYVKDQCDEPCYFIYNKKVNLRLKYSK
jgi:hypothetical protein